MTGRRLSPLARGLVELTVRGLTLKDRVRYREELTAELGDLARSRQLRHAVSALCGSLALRRALAHADPATGLRTARDWRCRIRWHRFQGRRDPTVRRDSTARRSICWNAPAAVCTAPSPGAAASCSPS